MSGPTAPELVRRHLPGLSPRGTSPGRAWVVPSMAAVVGLALITGCPRTSADVSMETAPDSAGAPPGTVGGGGEPGASEPGSATAGEPGATAGEAGSTAGEAGERSDTPGMNFKVVLGTAPCKTDADCFPTECCHPTACGNTKVDCAATMCTMDCRASTMDCGGGCSCVDGKCAARILDSIGVEG